jgi:hypothetical protein
VLRRSSLLRALVQVLISIQSMILGTADPYFNEPGYQGREGTAQ